MYWASRLTVSRWYESSSRCKCALFSRMVESIKRISISYPECRLVPVRAQPAGQAAPQSGRIVSYRIKIQRINSG